MQHKRNQTKPSCCPRGGGALLIAGAIAFYSVYTPLHLVTEHHCGVYEQGHPAGHHGAHHGAHHGGDGGGHHERGGQDSPHEPHPASDHQTLLSTLLNRTLSTDLPLFAPSFASFERTHADRPATVPTRLAEPRRARLPPPRHIRGPPLF